MIRGPLSSGPYRPVNQVALLQRALHPFEDGYSLADRLNNSAGDLLQINPAFFLR